MTSLDTWYVLCVQFRPPLVRSVPSSGRVMGWVKTILQVGAGLGLLDMLGGGAPPPAQTTPVVQVEQPKVGDSNPAGVGLDIAMSTPIAQLDPEDLVLSDKKKLASLGINPFNRAEWESFRNQFGSYAQLLNVLRADADSPGNSDPAAPASVPGGAPSAPVTKFAGLDTTTIVLLGGAVVATVVVVALASRSSAAAQPAYAGLPPMPR